MVYEIRYLKPHFKTIIDKLERKDKNLYNRLIKKIHLVVQSPYTVGHVLHGNLSGLWDTHVENSVLIYHIDDRRNTVTFVYFDHHDRVFRTATVALPSLMADLLRLP
jgi:addiction module RelE/StbE family toxin